MGSAPARAAYPLPLLYPSCFVLFLLPRARPRVCGLCAAQLQHEHILWSPRRSDLFYGRHALGRIVSCLVLRGARCVSRDRLHYSARAAASSSVRPCLASAALSSLLY